MNNDYSDSSSPPSSSSSSSSSSTSAAPGAASAPPSAPTVTHAENSTTVSGPVIPTSGVRSSADKASQETYRAEHGLGSDQVAGHGMALSHGAPSAAVDKEAAAANLQTQSPVSNGSLIAGVEQEVLKDAKNGAQLHESVTIHHDKPSIEHRVTDASGGPWRGIESITTQTQATENQKLGPALKAAHSNRAEWFSKARSGCVGGVN